MGFRFRRSVGILPGVRLNFSGSGTSVSSGGRGFRYTIGSRGKRVTVGLPGTGVSWSQYTPHVDEAADMIPSSPAYPLVSQAEELSPIQSAPASAINSMSTSELAPVLSRANSRLRIAPAISLISIGLFFACMALPDQSWSRFAAIYAVIVISATMLLDRYRRSVKVEFEGEGLVSRISNALATAFTELRSTAAAWVVQAEGATSDWKRNAGANVLNRRKRTSFKLAKPACIRTKMQFPTFYLGSDELYLLPDAALVFIKGEVAVVSYKELDFNVSNVRFIESERVPSDAEILDYTWQYVNKSGGPDRRFLSNTQLPICRYGEISFQSAGGLNCKLHVSKPEAANSLQKVIEALRRTPLDLPGTVKYVKTARSWPTIIFFLLFVPITLFQAVVVVRNFEDATKLASTRSSTSSEGRPAAIPSKPQIDSSAKNTGKQVGPPIDLKPAVPLAGSIPQMGASESAARQAQNLNDPNSVVWIQSRLRILGFLRASASGFDATTRTALREFKATNGLPSDERWDLATEEVLRSSGARRLQDTFIGSWSEGGCEQGAKPDITITSRRAASSVGGVCEFTNIRSASGGWTISTSCANAGEKWTASIQLTVSGDTLTWVGRAGNTTQYQRCR